MTRGTVIWMIIFAIAALLFFAVAAVVSVKGLSDLKDLLRTTKDESDE